MPRIPCPVWSGGGHEFEGVAVGRPDDAEVGAVQGGNAGCSKAFRDGDQAGVGAAEGQIGVAFDEFADALPVLSGERLDGQGAVDDRVVERRLGVSAEFSCQQVDRFSNDHRGGDQRTGRCLQQLRAGGVVSVGSISGSDQWTGVNDQHNGSVAAETVSE